jgi:hypothetical protein
MLSVRASIPDHVLFQVEIQVQQVTAGQEAHRRLLCGGGHHPVDGKAFQDLDVLRPEMIRRRPADTEALERDRS